MTSSTHWFASALLAALSMMATQARAATLAVVDIAQATAADVEALKRLPADDGWFELGTRLVLIGVDTRDVSVAPSATLLALHETLDPTRLMFRARGCSEHSSPLGTVITQGGRWELREVSASDRLALAKEPAHAWRAATPGSVYARQHRLDADKRGLAAADPAVQQVVDRIDAARWFADVETLASWDRSSYSTTSLEAARDWIAGQFEALGLTTTLPAFQMTQPGVGSITRHNVLGVWTGSTLPDRWIIVGAHYDSRNANISNPANTPGAEDNATGCAGVIELARALLPSQPRRSILFLCYSGEEQGLLGSSAHVQSLIAANDLGRVDLVATMDMIGYSADAGLDALFETSAEHAALLQRYGDAAAIYAPSLGVFTSTMPFGSDHVPYLDAGAPALLSIENDWDVYPHYHRTTDIPANLGPHAQAMGAAILTTNAAVIAETAGLWSEPFEDGFEESVQGTDRMPR